MTDPSPDARTAALERQLAVALDVARRRIAVEDVLREMVGEMWRLADRLAARGDDVSTARSADLQAVATALGAALRDGRGSLAEHWPIAEY